MNLQELKNQDMLLFSAAWCNPCKMIKPIVNEIISERSEKITIIDVDEMDKESTEYYGIRSIPAFVVRKDNEIVDKKSGLKTKTAILEFLEQDDEF